MKLIMTLVVRDEADILETQLRYHRVQGVDFFLVLDHRSLDNTREQLTAYEDKGWLKWFAIDQLQRDQGRWVTALAQRAYRDYGADWVINNDADEFWWVSQGNLKSYLAAVPTAYRLVYAPRVNFWAPNDQPAEANAPFWKTMCLQQATPLNFLGEPLSGKICHRGEANIEVHHGNHSVAPMQPEDIAPPQAETALKILHFPIRNYPQFEQKIRNGGGSWVANPHLSEQVGKAKRQLYSDYLTGKLPNFYRQWQARHNANNAVHNTTFRDFMEKINQELT